MSIFSETINSMKSQFIPTVDNKVKMTINGDIACPSGGEYRAFINGELTSVPEDILINIPLYRINKTLDQVRPGDIIKTTEKKTMKSGYVDPEGKYTYRKVLEVKDGSIKTISFSGIKSTKTPVKDFFFGQKTVSVIVNLFGNMFGNTDASQNNMQNMMMLAALSDSENFCGGDFKKILPYMMMSGNNLFTQNNGSFNPYIFAFMGNENMSDLAVLAMMQNNGIANNIFSKFVSCPNQCSCGEDKSNETIEEECSK